MPSCLALYLSIVATVLLSSANSYNQYENRLSMMDYEDSPDDQTFFYDQDPEVLQNEDVDEPTQREYVTDDGGYNTAPQPIVAQDENTLWYGHGNGKCIINHNIPKKCAGGKGGWKGVSVEGVGTFCMKGPVCVAQKKAGCPVAQPGLPKGSHCARIHTGVYGCRPNKYCHEHAGYCKIHKHIPRRCANGKDGWKPVSVEGVGTFCMKGPVCVAQRKAGCPVAQRGLPKGSHCARIKTGVYGCRPNKTCD